MKFSDADLAKMTDNDFVTLLNDADFAAMDTETLSAFMRRGNAVIQSARDEMYENCVRRPNLDRWLASGHVTFFG